jgi:hypothetical protein
MPNVTNVNLDEISHQAKMRIVLDVIDRHIFDHLRNPQTADEHLHKAVLTEFSLATAAKVHLG